MTPDARHYAYRVQWSPEDGEYVATVLEFPSLSWLAENQAEALDGLVQVVQGVLEDMEHTGEKIPDPLSERRFSGNFQIRTSPEVHRKLTQEAAEQHVSLNQLAIQRLVST